MNSGCMTAETFALGIYIGLVAGVIFTLIVVKLVQLRQRDSRDARRPRWIDR